MYEQKPLQVRAYEYMVKQIEAGELKPDVIYSETRTAAELGISRTPFKDALVRLAQDRYVDIIPSRGFRLHMITAEDIENTYEVRSAIECYCAVDLLHKKDTKEGAAAMKKMGRLLDEQQTYAADVSGIEDFEKADDAFHQVLVEFTRNSEFKRIYGTFSYWISRLADMTLRTEGRMEAAYKEHRRILDCLTGGDVLPVYQAVSAHLDTTRRLSLEMYNTSLSQNQNLW